MDKVQIKLVHEKLSAKPARQGFEQRALLLYLAFLKARSLASVEQQIHQSTYHRWHPLPHYVAKELDVLEVVAYDDFPKEAFKAWVDAHTSWQKPVTPHVKKMRPETKSRAAE